MLIQFIDMERAKILDIQPSDPVTWYFTDATHLPATRKVEVGEEILYEYYGDEHLLNDLSGPYLFNTDGKIFNVTGVWVNYTRTLPPQLTLCITSAQLIKYAKTE